MNKTKINKEQYGFMTKLLISNKFCTIYKIRRYTCVTIICLGLTYSSNWKEHSMVYSYHCDIRRLQCSRLDWVI